MRNEVRWSEDEGCQFVDFGGEEVRRIHQEVTRPTRQGASLQEGTLFEIVFTKGNDEADELAKDEATLHGGEMTQIRAETDQQKREVVQGTCSTQLGFIVWRSDMIVKNMNRSRSLWTKKETD